MPEEQNTSPEEQQANEAEAERQADEAAAKLLGDDSQDAPPSTETKTEVPSDESGQAYDGFTPSQTQIDAAKELGIGDDVIAKMTESEAKAYEQARSAMSKRMGRHERRYQKLEEEIEQLRNTSRPNREQNNPAGENNQRQFSPPDDETLTALFGDANSPAALNYKAAMELAGQVPALVERLNGVAQNVDYREKLESQRQADAFFDSLDGRVFSEFGKTTEITDGDDEHDARQRVMQLAQRMMTPAGDSDREKISYQDALKAAVGFVCPDAARKQAERDIEKKIKERESQRVQKPSSRNVTAPPSKMTESEREKAADAEAAERGLI